MKFVVWGLVFLLIVIHQDLWNWDNDRLVLGFLPVTLAYHAGISLGAGLAWFLAIHFAWPEGLDEETDATSHQGGVA